MPVVAVVLAAGFGTRFDENNPKQLVSVGDKPIVCWSIEAFERNDRVSDIIVVVNERVSNMVNMLIDEAGYTKVRAVIPGGSERVDSTRSALDLLKQAGIPDGAKILIHDSVRPFVEQQSIDGCIDSLDQFNAATVAYASTDTILLTEDLGERKVVRSVPDRTNAFRAQTPQAFRFGTITKAYELATRSRLPPNRRHPRGGGLSAERAGRHRRRIRNESQNHHTGRHADRREHRAQPRPGTCQTRSESAHARGVRRSILANA